MNSYGPKQTFVIALICLVLDVALLRYVGMVYVTNPQREDGFGAQYQTIIFSAIYAELTNRRFVYTPITTMEHNYNDDADFILKKEILINFIDNYKHAKDYKRVQQYSSEFYIAYFEAYVKKGIKMRALQNIKKIFRANKPADFFKNSNFNIAVHIRRPNSHDSRLQGADVPDQKFLAIIARLRQDFADRDYLIHIYSQGKPEDFTMYGGEKIILHLNEEVEETFTGMVMADALVTSPSSFSYAAALVSNGIIYYQPFWHPPLPNWLVLN